MLRTEENHEKRTEWTKVKQDIEDRLRKRRATFAAGAAIVAFIAILTVWSQLNTSQTGQAVTQPAHTDYVQAQSPPAPLGPSAAEIPEAQPTPGEQSLSLGELKWCYFTRARLAGGRQELDRLRTAGTETASAWSALVDQFDNRVGGYNALCASHQDQGAATLGGMGEREIASLTSQKLSELYQEGAAAASRLPPDFSKPPIPPAVQTPQAGGVVGAAQSPSSFAQGRADRLAWESWSKSVEGQALAGVEWWASVRSLRHRPTCEEMRLAHGEAFVQGCQAAKEHLDPTDMRRMTDPVYRAGWNSL